jgi:hypothetical protein
MRLLPIILPALLLGACGGGNGGTAISITSNDADGVFSASAGKDGKVKIDAPGLKGTFDIPGITLDASNLDINGVTLPPGSTVSGMNVESHGNGNGKGGVAIRFTSPIAPAAVRAWFQPKLAAEGFTLSAAGDGLAGTTDEGKPFRLQVAPAGERASQGTITIGQ